MKKIRYTINNMSFVKGQIVVIGLAGAAAVFIDQIGIGSSVGAWVFLIAALLAVGYRQYQHRTELSKLFTEIAEMTPVEFEHFLRLNAEAK